MEEVETSWKVAIVAFSVTCEVFKQCANFATRSADLLLVSFARVSTIFLGGRRRQTIEPHQNFAFSCRECLHSSSPQTGTCSAVLFTPYDYKSGLFE